MKLPSMFVEAARQRWQDVRNFWGTWRTGARDDYAFVAGDQWEADDVSLLKEQDRPKVTFNYSEKMIDAVHGAEVSNRHEVTYFPREVNDAGVTEVWTAGAKWVRDECNAEYEETDAFRDCLICGLGWTETYLAYDEDQDGKLYVGRIDPLEMYADPTATKPGLSDRRYDFRSIWVDETEVAKKYPGMLITGLDTSEIRGGGVIRAGHRYEDDMVDEEEMHKDQVQLLQYECWYREPVIRVLDPETAQLHEMDEGKFKQVQTALDTYNIQYVRQMKKVYYQAVFAGEQLLEAKLSPSQVGFTRQCITGKRDRNQNTWYGLTRTMKDPQRWANKWLSQIMHIINSNAKGGLLAETGAFVDPRKAQDEWASPDAITLLREGGLNKIREKTVSNYPSGIDRLMEFALNSLPQVTGINLEALGLANRDQAGVLEQQRKQAAYGLLSPLFDSLRRYRKDQGKVLLYFMQEYLSDGRLVRIVGPQGAQYVPLTKDRDALKYDVIVDEAPDSPDSKSKTWEVLQSLIPAMLKANLPIPPSLFDYSPLPASLAQEWKKFVQENPGQVSPQQMQQLQQKLQQLQEENMQLKMDQSAEQAQLAMKAQAQQQDAALSNEKTQREFQLKMIEMDREFALKVKELEMEFQIKIAEFQQESALQQTELAVNHEMHQQQFAQKKDQATQDMALKAVVSAQSLSNNADDAQMAAAVHDSQKIMADAIDKMAQALIVAKGK